MRSQANVVTIRFSCAQPRSAILCVTGGPERRYDVRPPIATNEVERIAALRRYDLPAASAYDDIARVAARVCGAPIALVSFEDDDRQWLEVPDVLVVPDMLEDPRFVASPRVTGPLEARFYAGAPLITPDGHVIGALCVLDHVPRQLTPEQVDLLRVLARQVVSELELRRSRAAQATTLAERDRVQAVLEQERAFLRRIIDTQPSMVFVKDWDGRFVLVNEALARCYGSTVEGVVGKTDADLNADAAEVVHFVQDDREVMLSRRTKLIPEEPVTSAAGQVGWFSTVKVPLVNEDGTCDKVLGVATDISTQRRALIDLRETEQLHRTLADVAPGFVWTVGADGRFEYVNRTWEEFTGSSCEELNAGGWLRFNHPDELDEVERRWTAALEGGTSFEMELRYRRRDGVFRWMLSRVVPVKDGEGRVTRWVGSSVDIDDLKQVEAARRAGDERLRQAQRLEAVGRLAGGVAHDLNNMLVTILGYSEFVAETLPPADSRREDVEAITEAATRSASLTRQLLAFARRDLVAPRRFDLNAMVRTAERMLRLAVGETVDLRLELPPGELLAYADVSRIEQVLMNLVLNARDAMAGGGRLVIETGRADLDSAYVEQHPGASIEPNRYVLLAVTDTGHGMDRETLARLFEPFFTTKPVGKGTGLGLSTAYGSVKQAGGDIWVESEVGRGSVFKVYLPEADGAADPPLPVGRAAPGEGKVILVVDDADGVRTTTCRSLERVGYRPIAVGTGPEAVELVRVWAEPIDLVLTDVVMPGMSGRELADQLETLRPGLPVLFVSGHTQEDIVRRGLVEEGRPFLAKPFTPDEIAAKVGAVLGRHTSPA